MRSALSRLGIAGGLGAAIFAVTAIARADDTIPNPPAPTPPVAEACTTRVDVLPAHRASVSRPLEIPAITEQRQVPVTETVQVPVLEERRVPVTQEIDAPVYATRDVPVFEDRRVPIHGQVE